ncbi:MotA/TolQ/ExbB proton channel family protein [Poseidonibacter lekithochrous]|uniref:MotA/TolQ/ExbB proton channel family protein n=1 Tax=Poseidonibacter lekithochrous TaxID=1904463 RepID=UPI0008FCB6EF|nr:MotA/TolQ/ExbB proton channel family protein [Poseidonibacter lekithochrous]QKJ21860.1 ExbB domain-containing protein [Poseidonibacter lekithochrous]
MIKYILTLCLASTLAFSLNLEGLLQSVKNDANKELQVEKQRLQEFIDNKNEQATLLSKSKKILSQEEAESEKLKKIIDANELLLEEKETELSTKAASLGQMFGSVRQSSSDFLTNFQNSLTASQDPLKEEIFTKFANSKKLPNLEELTLFWHSMLDEIIKSGNISQYETNVILNTGVKVNEEVTRVGLFAAVSNGKYLTYSNDMKSLVELAVQPNSNVLSDARAFEKSNTIENITVDPTRGTLFEMIENNPTILDRVNQGGIVGYVILALGGLGLLVALYKMIVLNISSIKIKSQIKNIDKPKTNNSLGKIADIFYKNVNDSINDLEIKIGEAILRETNNIKKGQSFVKLLAAVTPLLGLLGTVTGMIATFQAITLFGTGDPKLMAGGISTALITTVLGLITAIPLLFAYTYISSKSEELVSILEEQSIGLLAKTLK